MLTFQITEDGQILYKYNGAFLTVVRAPWEQDDCLSNKCTVMAALCSNIGFSFSQSQKIWNERQQERAANAD